MALPMFSLARLIAVLDVETPGALQTFGGGAALFRARSAVAVRSVNSHRCFLGSGQFLFFRWPIHCEQSEILLQYSLYCVRFITKKYNKN